jgi:putative ABC transport system substrate-binding protein
MKTWLSGLLVTLVLLLTVVLTEAQQPAKTPRIGYLGLDDPSSPLLESFRQGLRELGYVEGQNIIIESKFTYGNSWRLDGLVSDLVRLKVAVIVTQNVGVVRDISKTTPIVMIHNGDPVQAGIIASLDRPGANITGIGGLSAGLGGKWLEILKETVPVASRIGVLYSSGVSPIVKEMEDAARSLRVELQLAKVEFSSRGIAVRWRQTGPRVGSVFSWAIRDQADALIVLPAAILDENEQFIVSLTLGRRVPSIFSRAKFAEAGGFMSYGANQIEQFRRAAYFVDKILKGAKPAELPIELPKKFELTINLKTAKEIGITIPPRVLAWADKVIK